MSSPEEFLQIALADHAIVEHLKKRMTELGQFTDLWKELQKILGDEK